MTEQQFITQFQAVEIKLFRLAKRMLREEALAKDAVQDLALKLFKKRNQLGKYSNLEVVFMVAMKNHCFDQLKRNKRKRTEQLGFAVQRLSNTNTPQQIIEGKNILEIVKKIINELPKKQRLVVQLRDIEQLEMSEIEEITQLSNETIRANLSRARKTIREKIKEINQYGLA